MNTSNPFSLDTLTSKGAPSRVLRFLWKSREEWSGREIARQSGLSAPSAHEALKRLYERGLVRFRRVSNIHLYQANEENRVFQKVIVALFEAELAVNKELDRTIAETLVGRATRKGVLSIVSFGSRARGDTAPSSDLDILIVVTTKAAFAAVEAPADALRSLVGRRFNIPISPIIQTLAEVRRKRSLPLYANILRDGRLLYGTQLNILLRSKSDS